MAGIKIWIDLDNTPHVPFFKPIIRELEQRGHKVVITARDAFQVCDLADKLQVPYVKIGRHYGKKRIMKLIGLLWRSVQLFPFYSSHRPDLALSHGSRSFNLFCNLFGTPNVVFNDYEHSWPVPLAGARWLIEPEALSSVKISQKHRLFYRGIKEDVYVPEYKVDPSIIDRLNFQQNETTVLVRPPADEAHYHNPESKTLLIELMERICQTQGVRSIMLPRNKQQEASFRKNHPMWFEDHKTIIPYHAEDGLNIIWHSDLIVSGGGTMNREAAALGVPVYSVFRGKTGAVDRMLEREGRLTMIHNVEEVWTKIKFVRREINKQLDGKPRPALLDIINYIEDIIRIELKHLPKSGAMH